MPVDSQHKDNRLRPTLRQLRLLLLRLLLLLLLLLRLLLLLNLQKVQWQRYRRVQVIRQLNDIAEGGLQAVQMTGRVDTGECGRDLSMVLRHWNSTLN